jgi:hypothetical protein
MAPEHVAVHDPDMGPDNRKAQDRSFALWSLVHGYAMLVLDDRIAGLRPDRRKADARAHVQRLVAPLAASFEAP